MGHGKSKKEVKSNITDNESAKMKPSHGVIQGYTGVAAVDSRYQVVVHAEAYGQGQEHGLAPGGGCVEHLGRLPLTHVAWATVEEIQSNRIGTRLYDGLRV